MSNRPEILDAIKEGKSNVHSLAKMPDLEGVFQPGAQEGPLLDLFIQSARQQGADIAFSTDIPDKGKWISSMYPEAENILSAVAGEGLPSALTDQSGRPDFRQVDLSIIRGAFGVAENGSIWVPESSLPMRVIPFICAHLIIVLDSMDLVANMHEAYRRNALADAPFGVFIAGPSKTADIEQSLVIGAQGPRSVMILLEKKNA